MQIHIISLPQRRKLIEEEIKRMNIDAVYWPAIILPNTITAISQSHKRIVKFALDNNLSEIAIGEDDLIFSSLNGWKYFLDNKPDDFDIYLGGIYGGIPLPDKSLYGFKGLHCYIINSRFYKKFLSVPETRNIDAALDGSGKFYCCNPLVAKQRNGYSFHRKDTVNDDHYLNGRKFLLD